MIETHHDPDNAWSDAEQQVTAEILNQITADLRIRKEEGDDIDIIIKTFNSNLRGKPKVIFNNFLNKIGFPSERKPENKKNENFSIPKELIRRKLRAIPKEKADKARKYAYALTSKKLAKN